MDTYAAIPPLGNDIMRQILDIAQQYRPHLGYKTVKGTPASLVAFVSEEFYTWLEKKPADSYYMREHHGRHLWVWLGTGEETGMTRDLGAVQQALRPVYYIVLGRKLVGAQKDLFALLRDDIDTLTRRDCRAENESTQEECDRLCNLESDYAFALMMALEEAGREFRLAMNGWDYVCALKK